MQYEVHVITYLPIVLTVSTSLVLFYGFYGFLSFTTTNLKGTLGSSPAASV